jgi:uncharacterized protein
MSGLPSRRGVDVERGQVLERMTIVPGPAGPLEALYQGGGLARSDSSRLAVLVLPPHPRLLGNADAAVLGEIVWRLGLAGVPTLRFNYRGVGASAGTIGLPPLFDGCDMGGQVERGLDDLIDDSRAALGHLRATWSGPIGLVGYSVGGVVADLLSNEADQSSVLVSPAWHRMPRRQRREVVAIVAAEDGVLRRCCRTYGCDPIVIEGATPSYVRGLPAMARAVAVACGAVDSG